AQEGNCSGRYYGVGGGRRAAGEKNRYAAKWDAVGCGSVLWAHEKLRLVSCMPRALDECRVYATFDERGMVQYLFQAWRRGFYSVDPQLAKRPLHAGDRFGARGLMHDQLSNH